MATWLAWDKRVRTVVPQVQKHRGVTQGKSRPEEDAGKLQVGRGSMVAVLSREAGSPDGRAEGTPVQFHDGVQAPDQLRSHDDFATAP